MLEHISWEYYDNIAKSYIDPEDNLVMKQYLDISEDGYKGIINYQRDMRKKKLEERHKRETDPWDLAMSKVPALPTEWEHWVDKQAIHYNYIFYDYSRKKQQIGYCSWCEKEVPIKKPKHNKMGKCPCCRHTIQYKAKGRTGRFETAAETAYLLQPCGDDLVIRQFKVKRYYVRGGYKMPKRHIFEERRVIYNSAMESERFYYGLYKNSYSRWIKGDRICYNPYGMYYYDHRDYEGAVYRRNLPYLARTRLSRTGLTEIIGKLDKLDPEVYLETLKEKPYLEQLAKAGIAPEQLAEPPIELEKLEQTILDFDQQLVVLKDREKQLLEKIADQPEPELTVLQETLAEKEAEVAQFQQQHYAKENQIKGQRDLVEKIEALQEQSKEQLDELSQMIQLYQTMNGDNPQKISLERYVLQWYLAEVLQSANQQLKQLTKGRYHFELKQETGRSKGNTGLEINVYDDNAGATRSSHTLSGGESFIAALSLALGLAEVIQNQAGGVAIEALFIDEGFGSLDEEALEMAMEALEGIESAGRMIGIISHVRELKERIPQQIVVETSGTGRSSIRYQLEGWSEA